MSSTNLETHVRDFTEQRRMGRRTQERGPVCLLDLLNPLLRLRIVRRIDSGSEMMPA